MRECILTDKSLNVKEKERRGKIIQRESEGKIETDNKIRDGK